MNLDELLERFETLHGNMWPGAVIDRFVYLASRPMPTEKEEAEYILLRDWIQEMVEAGIAPRPTERRMKMFNRIHEAILAAKDEQDHNFDAAVHIADDLITIDTRITRDWRRSSNGGEYSYWLKIWPHRGNVLVQEKCTCDFWQPEDEPEVYEAHWDAVRGIVKDMAGLHNVPVIE